MKREIDKSDRRNMTISLSRKGKILTNKVNDAFIDIHSDILKEIETSKHEPLINTMEHLKHEPLINTMEHLDRAVEKWLNKG
jgi:DNA-binding MarR family transcriptional regulator